jgi:hypothetical protein
MVWISYEDLNSALGHHLIATVILVSWVKWKHYLCARVYRSLQDTSEDDQEFGYVTYKLPP